MKVVLSTGRSERPLVRVVLSSPDRTRRARVVLVLRRSVRLLEGLTDVDHGEQREHRGLQEADQQTEAEEEAEPGFDEDLEAAMKQIDEALQRRLG